MTGAHRRSVALPFSTMQVTTSRVVNAQRGAASGGVPSGTFINCSKMCGITVTGVSMMTVPVTVGVRMRRNRERRAENANWHSARMKTRVASNDGPPALSAAMLTAMAAPAVPIGWI